MVCAVRWTTSSGTSASTFGSARRSCFWCSSSLAEKPRKALGEAAIGLDAVALVDLVDDGGRVRAAAEHDDVPAGGVERAGLGRVRAVTAGAGSTAGSGYGRGVAARAGPGLGCGRRLSGLELGLALELGAGSRDGRHGRRRGRARRRFAGGRWGDDRECDEHAEEQGGDPAIHAHHNAPRPHHRLRHLGPVGS